MAWKVYKLVLEAKSPIHIGYKGVGMIKRTRYYIPGKNFWGAATAKLTPLLSPGEYEEVGGFVRGTLPFTYFYPSLAPSPEEALIPDYTSEGLCYNMRADDSIRADEFEYLFISSHGSTAINPHSGTAEEGTLHEIEFILPRTKDKGKQVYFVGYLMARDGASFKEHDLKVEEGRLGVGKVDFLQTIVDDIQAGGERGYGFGRLVLYDWSRADEKKLFGRYELRRGKELRITVSPDQPIPAHLKVGGIELRGDIEPLTSREWDQRRGAGQRISSDVQVCFVPGSRLKEEASLRLDLNRYGILEACSSVQS